MWKFILSKLSSLGSGVLGGFSTKILLGIIFALLGLCLTFFVSTRYYQKAYNENLAQKAEISAQFNQTRIILQKQNEAIQKANTELNNYKKEILNIKKATARDFEALKKKNIQTCTDFSAGVAELLKTYAKTPSPQAQEGE